MRKGFIALAGSIIIASSHLQAGFLDGLLSGKSTTGETGGIPGLAGFPLGLSLSCDQNFGLDQLLGKAGICGIADKLGGLLGKIDLMGCSIIPGFGTGQSGGGCYEKGLADMCKKLTSGKLDDVMSPVKNILASTKELGITKGDAFKDEKCGTEGETKYPSGETDASIARKTGIVEMTKRFGSPFSTEILQLRDCMKTDGDKCLKDGEVKLPKDALEVEKQIAEASSQIAAAGKSYVWDTKVAERNLQKKANLCLKLPTPEETKACVEKLMKGEDGPDALQKKALADLELAEAAELLTVKKATRCSSRYIYTDKESVKRLPIAVIPDYIDGVARQNAADTVFLALWKENLATKKGMVKILYKKMEQNVRPYDRRETRALLRHQLGLKD
jgi:hypothetical protein